MTAAAATTQEARSESQATDLGDDNTDAMSKPPSVHTAEDNGSVVDVDPQEQAQREALSQSRSRLREFASSSPPELVANPSLRALYAGESPAAESVPFKVSLRILLKQGPRISALNTYSIVARCGGKSRAARQGRKGDFRI